MIYELSATENFDLWLTHLDGSLKKRLASRLAQVECGNFGDFKLLGESLFELRFTYGGGLRVYYTLRGSTVVLLISGGNKSSQAKDIAKAKLLLAELE